VRAGFPRANAGLLESDVVRHNFPSQATRSSVDGSPFNLEDRITTASVCLSYLSLNNNEP
jgi:pre-mRNA cleavage complex 2 protein Pcf11